MMQSEPFRDASDKKVEEETINHENAEDKPSSSLNIVQAILDDITTNIGKFVEVEDTTNDTITETVKAAHNLSRMLSYPAQNRPRQPFMPSPSTNQPTNNPSRLPAPPSYYTSQVTGDLHQPQYLRRIYGPQQQGEVYLNNNPNFQPGQMTIMPNTFMNVAYWAPYPANIPNGVPACLAHLVAADSLFVIQQVDIIELFMEVSEPNFYLIQNKNGQCIYYAYETTDICAQICCRSSRGYQLHVMDMYHNEIIYMNKPCGCDNYFCCYPVMEVYSPPLVPVGAIIKKFNFLHEEFSVLDAEENKIFQIYGPCSLMLCRCTVDAKFTIHALDSEKTEVGIIMREYGGFVRTFFTNADSYGITFPIDLDVRIKAIFLGALFFVDYTFFEN